MMHSNEFRKKMKLRVCCLSGSVHDPLDYKQLEPSSKSPRTPCSSWLKKLESHHRKHHHHRHSHSADFTYDSSSYALNFEDHDFPSRDFASRLMPSPPPTPSSTISPT